MNEYGSRFGEGYFDPESENEVEQNPEVKEELETFEESWSTSENASLMSRVIKKINKGKNTEAILKEIRNLDNQLTDTMGDEDEQAEVLSAYLKDSAAEDEDEDEEDEWSVAA